MDDTLKKTETKDFPARSYPDPPSINHALEYARGTKNMEAEKYLKRLQDRSNAYGAGYGTHLPLLCALLPLVEMDKEGSGHILELGAGNFSTPVLSCMCRALHLELMTLEEQAVWLENFEDIIDANPYHRSVVVPDPYNYIPTIDSLSIKHWGLVFVDHGRTNQDRMAALRYLQDKADFIVIHDTQNTWFAGVDRVLDSFEFRYDYELMTPVTTVVSNKFDVKAVLNIE
jgi:hypothetical protein